MLILELMIRGWTRQYARIRKEFGYKEHEDLRAARRLNKIIQKQDLAKLKTLKASPVFVIGSGPSLKFAIPILKKYKKIIKICADTALEELVKNKIHPEFIVTDLDGNLNLIKNASKSSTIIVHAHGDNIQKLEIAKNFQNVIGTTQTKKTGKITNFGGFTDGDRCVFLASSFEASKIFLFGMDFGPKIGTYSKTKKSERKIKLKKLEFAKMLLEWFAPKSKSELYTLSKPIKGFKKITYRELEHRVSS